jgi:hypothetical protein
MRAACRMAGISRAWSRAVTPSDRVKEGSCLRRPSRAKGSPIRSSGIELEIKTVLEPDLIRAIDEYCSTVAWHTATLDAVVEHDETVDPQLEFGPMRAIVAAAKGVTMVFRRYSPDWSGVGLDPGYAAYLSEMARKRRDNPPVVIARGRVRARATAPVVRGDPEAS